MDQDMICFSCTFLASEENVWSVDWNGHFLPHSFYVKFNWRLRQLKHYETEIWFLDFPCQRSIGNLSSPVDRMQRAWD